MSEPTRPIKPAPEWVGEGDSRKDISIMGDRGIAVMALDAVLRLSDTIKRHSDEFREFLNSDAKTKMILLQEIPNHAARITALEVAMQESRYKSAMIPVIAEEEREERPSKHEWDEILVKAGEELSRRVKDPKDRIDSIRARQIAQEVYQSATTANDAHAFRALKSGTGKVLLEVLKWLVAFAVGLLAARYGLHFGG